MRLIANRWYGKAAVFTVEIAEIGISSHLLYYGVGVMYNSRLEKIAYARV